MRNPNAGRSSIFAVVGAYLTYLAYEFIRDMVNGVPTSMAPALTIVFAVLFAGIGITLLVFAWIFWRKGRADQDQNPVDLEAQEEGAKSEEEAPGK